MDPVKSLIVLKFTFDNQKKNPKGHSALISSDESDTCRYNNRLAKKQGSAFNFYHRNRSQPPRRTGKSDRIPSLKFSYNWTEGNRWRLSTAYTDYSIHVYDMINSWCVNAK